MDGDIAGRRWIKILKQCIMSAIKILASRSILTKLYITKDLRNKVFAQGVDNVQRPDNNWLVLFKMREDVF